MLKPITSENQAIVAEEEAILSEVLRRLVDYLDERKAYFKADNDTVYHKARQSLLDLRELIGEAKSFDVAHLTEQMLHLAAVATHADPNLAVPADPTNPYFAHMQLYENGKVRDVLIGKRSFVDPKNKFNIVDWRHAPVSRLYYTTEEGSEYDAEYADREVEGKMLIRRAIAIYQGVMRRIQAPQAFLFRNDTTGMWMQDDDARMPILKGGEGRAKRAPKDGPKAGQHRFGTGDDAGYRVDKHLPEIAALIDPEQFHRIALPSAGLVILQGGAGSGKTTVALHRVAFLHFQDKFKFSAEKLLITVFSRALARYIEKVLPALDVHHVKVETYYDWAHKKRRQVVPSVPKTEWDDIPEVAARIKKHPAMLTVLADYVGEQVAACEAELRARVSPFLMDLWARHRDKPPIPRLQVLDHNKNHPKGSVTDGLVIEKWLAKIKNIRSDWANIITDRQRLQKALSAQGIAFPEYQWDIFLKYTTLQTEEVPELPEDPSDDVRAVDGGEDAEPLGQFDCLDNTLVLRLSQLKYGAIRTDDGREVSYNHAVIDEAQDLSPLEIQVVVDVTENESVTLAGDTAQKLIFDNGFTNWSDLLKSLGKSAIHLEPLRIGYRSTYEINTFGREILGHLAPSDPLESKRAGVPVEVFRFRDTGETMAFLTETLRALTERERQCNCALLAPNPEVAKLYFEGLKKAEIHPLRHIVKQEFPFTPGIDVTDISQIKGLEYDYVIVLEATQEFFPETDEARHYLHIATTRAAHQLWLLATGNVSKLIPPDYVSEK